MVYRVYVERKQGFDVEAKALLNRLEKWAMRATTLLCPTGATCR